MKKLLLSVFAAAAVLTPLSALAGTGPSSSGSVPINLTIASWVSVAVPSSMTVNVTGFTLVSGSYVGTASTSGTVTVYSNCGTGGTIGAAIATTATNPTGVTWSTGLATPTYPFGTSTNTLTVTASNVTLADKAGSYTDAATVTVTVTNAS